MHTVTLKIQDHNYDYIMYLLKNLNHKDVEVIEHDLDYKAWDQSEIDAVGRLGLHSKSFVEDTEDYSKW